jgi:CBS domain-containing protein
MKPVFALLKSSNATLWHIHPDETVYEALKVLAEHEIGALMVLDHGKVIGILSERDYTRKVALQGRNSKETRVAEIMTRDVISVSAHTDTREAMALMSRHRIRHLPVIEGTEVLGMISIRDILDDIIADDERTIEQLQNYISS